MAMYMTALCIFSVRLINVSGVQVYYRRDQPPDSIEPQRVQLSTSGSSHEGWLMLGTYCSDSEGDEEDRLVESFHTKFENKPQKISNAKDTDKPPVGPEQKKPKKSQPLKQHGQ